jgi:hypothetical protein
MVFYQVFLLSPLQCTVIELQNETVRGCMSLNKQKSQGNAVEVTGKTFVWILSMNSASCMNKLL